MMNTRFLSGLITWLSLMAAFQTMGAPVTVDVYQPVIPVLIGRDNNPVLKIIPGSQDTTGFISEIKISLSGKASTGDIEKVSIFYSKDPETFSTTFQFGKSLAPASKLTFKDHFALTGKGFLWVSVKLKSKADLLHKIGVTCLSVKTDMGMALIKAAPVRGPLRIGIALRQHMQDGVHTYRIPGLTTTPKGVLLAVYDVRRKSSRDLQGDIDIGMSRSVDGGSTWEPMKIVLDRGTWGGLPQKYNGVSDPCILTDENTGDIYVAALWMYGVLDQNGKWVEGLTETSEAWNHQWREKGSQPGFDVKQSAQFLITKSKDDGLSWSEPQNITSQCKRKEWWLFAPAPGHGITLSDGTLVFPSQGRDENGLSFSNIMWSKDHGMTWNVSTPACFNTSECMVVQRADGSLMLNVRDNRNKQDTTSSNGRAVFVTTDLGKTWTEHPTSHKALIEPVCMASIHKHTYTVNGEKQSVLLFSNPDSKQSRKDITIKVSFDNGVTWPSRYWILLDEYKGRGYSCITSIGEQYIGILYESSQADLVFQKIALDELLKR